MVRALLISSACALCGAAPIDLGQDGLEIKLGAPDPLLDEAQQVLDRVSIKRCVEKLVTRKRIRSEALPVPHTFPTGSLQLQMSDKRLNLADRFAAKASWSTTIPEPIDGQFVYHMHVAHFVGLKYCDGHSKWGVAMAQFSGNTYGTLVNAMANQPGQHRLLGILSAWSIKTEDTYILDVAETVYAVEDR